MISSAFWRDRAVFVTGHTGFKGAWLSLALERLAARTTGYGLPPTTSPSLYELADAGAALCDVRGDVCDAVLLDGALRAADPDIVIHLATRAPRRADQPAPDMERSAFAEGGRALIDAVQRAPSVQTTLIVSPETRKTPRGRSRVIGRYGRVLSVYCPDPTGGGDFAGCANAASSLHVLDVVYGLLLLAEKACDGRERVGSGWAFAEPEDAAALGWTPLLSAEEAADWTADWRRAWAAGADMRAVTLQQVDAYFGQRVQFVSPFASEDRRSLRDVA
jgi:CDP-glucose 4,6-dehydratase